MSAAASPLPAAPHSASRPYLALGLTFLLLGIGFANPFHLVRAFPRGMWEGEISREALNLYALTAFLGWAHFTYAWRGQWHASARLLPTRRASYWLAIALLLIVLIAARSILGVAVFSLITWVYNIAHFMKAEAHFAGDRVPAATPRQPRSRLQWPAVTFAWFTLVLFRVGPLDRPALVFAGTLALAATALVLGDWKALANGERRMPLLTLFFLGETLVWSAYSPYMTPAFRVGVYILLTGRDTYDQRCLRGVRLSGGTFRNIAAVPVRAGSGVVHTLGRAASGGKRFATVVAQASRLCRSD